MIKKFLIVFICSLAICLLITPLRGGYFSIASLEGLKLSSLVSILLYFPFTFLILDKFEKTMSMFAIMFALYLGQSALLLPIHIIHFDSTLASFLEYLIQVFAISIGCIIFLFKSIKIRVTISILILILGYLLSTTGYDIWLHKLNFGTFSGKIENITDVQLEFQSIEGNTLSLSDFKGKYLILDCWYTRCGVCYKEMPKVQELYNKYKNNTKVQAFVLHSRMEDENFSTGARILGERGYTLPCLSVDIDNPSLKELGVKVYPTVLLFNRESKLIFRGDIESTSKYLEKRLKDDAKKRD